MSKKLIGILDPEGNNPNPFTDKPFTDTFRNRMKTWQTFPMYQKMKPILDILDKNRVILLSSSTGSGKSVLIGPLSLHYGDYKNNVVITNPKSLSTRETATYVAQTFEIEPGMEIGYQYKGSNPAGKSDKTRLLFCTDGTLFARLINDPSNVPDIIIVDEAHEMTNMTILLLKLIKEIMQKNTNLKLIVMSATANTPLFIKYFLEFKPVEVDAGTATLYPIETTYLIDKPIKQDDVLSVGVSVMQKLIPYLKSGKESILFFVNSRAQGQKGCKLLREQTKNEIEIPKTFKGGAFENIFCTQIAKGISDSEKKFAIEELAYMEHPQQERMKLQFERKVVMATNIAEAAITIKGVKFVIDSGTEIVTRYDPKTNIVHMLQQRISKAQAIQRKGRSGRTGNGYYFPLYTALEYEQMKAFPTPNIKTSNIVNEVFMLFNRYDKKEIVDSFMNSLIDSPSKELIDSSFLLLEKNKLLKGNQLTPLGKLAVKLSQAGSPSLALFLLLSIGYGCQFEATNIVCMMSACEFELRNLFLDIPRERQHEEKSIRAFRNKICRVSDTSDHLNLLQTYMYFIKEIPNDFRLQQEKAKRGMINLNVVKNAQKQALNMMRKLETIEKEALPILQDILKEKPKRENKMENIMICLYGSHQAHITKPDLVTDLKVKCEISEETTIKKIKKEYNYMVVYNNIKQSFNDDKPVLNIVSMIHGANL